MSRILTRIKKTTGRLLGRTTEPPPSDTNSNPNEVERDYRRQSQVLREAGTLMGATLDLDTVLERLLEQVQRLLPYVAAWVLLVDGDRAVAARLRGFEAFDESKILSAPDFSFSIQNTADMRWMLENQQPYIVPDTLTDPEWVWTEGLSFIRSSAGAPLVAQGKVIAFLYLLHTRSGFYLPDIAEILMVFAGQAAMAITNARLFDETLESLERERRLNEVTRTISSALDLPTILNNVVRLAAELTGADAGSMAILAQDGQSIAYPSVFNLPAVAGESEGALNSGISSLIITSGKSIRLDDYSAHPNANPSLESAGLHAFIGVPVVSGEACLGSLGLFSFKKDRRFSERELGLAELVGRQAGITIQNARFYEAAQRRAKEAETLRQAVSAVANVLDLDQVLDTILVQIEKVVPLDSASIFLQENSLLRLVSGRGYPVTAGLIGRTFPVDNELYAEMRQTRRPVYLMDAANDPRFQRWGGINFVKSWMGVPLIAQGQTIGALTIDSSQLANYSDASMDLVQAFANEAAMAIVNARLFEQVHQLAITDPLTGLYNRRYFFDTASQEFERTRRYGGPLSLIILDVDHFKLVNDTYGHLVGDRALIELAQCCLKALREVDVMARYGGEEFIILLPETPVERACQVADRLQALISDMVVHSAEDPVSVAVSIGVAGLDESCLGLENLIEHADQALYAAKCSGRGRVFLWDESII